ncbi:MAG: hypothetical protein AB3N23_21985 [Paracoccaceae bacterium]
MKSLAAATSFACFVALSACSSGGGGSLVASSPVASSFGTVVGNQLATTLSNENNGTVSNAAVGTVAYISGLNQTTGQAVTAAGIAGTPTVGPARTTGTATYAARYEYDTIINVERNGTVSTRTIGGNRINRSGAITLNADFDQGTLRGDALFLNVNGTISGSELGGSVRTTPNIVSTGRTTGELQGQIGATGVIGAFHGTETSFLGNSTVAGGFVGVAN